MKTLERPREAAVTATAAPHPSRRWIAMAVVAALALAIGGVAGWMIRGDDNPALVLAGDGSLTARQEQMLDVVREGELAWRAGDADAVLALCTPDATVEVLGTVYRADDGTLAALIENGDWASLDVLEPVLVNGNEMFTFHRWGGVDRSETFVFTSSGELLITSHVVHT